MRDSLRLCILLSSAFLLIAVQLPAQSRSRYSGPRPPKTDVPYLVHAGTLVETESGEARQSQKKDDTIYSVSGASSPARTPLAEPIFLLQSSKLNPDRLSLYKMKVEGSERTLTIPNPGKRRKDTARPVYLLITPLDNGLFKIEVNEYSENGEYCLSPEGSNQVFCFAIY